MNFTDVGEVAGAAELLVYEHGWQSWSPTGTYPAHVTSPRPASRDRQVLGFRPEKPLPRSGFQGEGLLAVAPRGGADGRPGRYAPRRPTPTPASTAPCPKRPRSRRPHQRRSPSSACPSG